MRKATATPLTNLMERLAKLHHSSRYGKYPHTRICWGRHCNGDHQ